MVDPDPDVPYAFLAVAQELGERRCRLFGKKKLRVLRPEHRRCRASGGLPSQQSAVRRVEFEEQAVLELDAGIADGCAVDLEDQHCIGAVGVVVDELIDGPLAAFLAGMGDLEPGERVALARGRTLRTWSRPWRSSCARGARHRWSRR